MTAKNYYDNDITTGDTLSASEFMAFVDKAVEAATSHAHSGGTRDGISVLQPTDIYKFKLMREDKVGSNFSGSDGDANRTITLANTRTIQTSIVYYDGVALSSSNYSIGTGATATLTIVKNLYNEQEIIITYTQ